MLVTALYVFFLERQWR